MFENILDLEWYVDLQLVGMIATKHQGAKIYMQYKDYCELCRKNNKLPKIIAGG